MATELPHGWSRGHDAACCNRTSSQAIVASASSSFQGGNAPIPSVVGAVLHGGEVGSGEGGLCRFRSRMVVGIDCRVRKKTALGMADARLAGLLGRGLV